MSTTILGFHRVTMGVDGRPNLRLERHGSMHINQVRDHLDRLGFGLTLAPGARTRLHLREYDDSPLPSRLVTAVTDPVPQRRTPQARPTHGRTASG